METLYLGGLKAKDEERIYFEDANFTLPSGQRVVVTRSEIPGINMPDLFARHEARYDLVRFFCRPGMRVLDFPCGPGYAAHLLSARSVDYTGLDFDVTTVEYARHVHNSSSAHFARGDLRNSNILENTYDVIACIEGLEHIGIRFQDELLHALRVALKPGGVLVISSPENPSKTSGQSAFNPHHRGELTESDFKTLLHRHFLAREVQILSTTAILSTGQRSRCFYGICRKA